jgi:transposase-like protein
MTIEAALGAEMEHHLGYAKHEQNTNRINSIVFGFSGNRLSYKILVLM